MIVNNTFHMLQVAAMIFKYHLSKYVQPQSSLGCIFLILLAGLWRVPGWGRRSFPPKVQEPFLAA